MFKSDIACEGLVFLGRHRTALRPTPGTEKKLLMIWEFFSSCELYYNFRLKHCTKFVYLQPSVYGI